MNTETQSLHRSISPQTAIRTAALAALFALAPAAAFADSPATLARDTRVANVSLAGLDLSTSEGARVALKRITAVARRLCSEFGNSSRISNRETISDCVRDTLDAAVRQFNSPTLAALQK